MIADASLAPIVEPLTNPARYPALALTSSTRPLDESQLAIERLIVSLLALRKETSSICPSEIARAIDADAWRALMAPIRAVAIRLALAGIIEISQHGVVVVPNGHWRGPVRLSRGKSWARHTL